jgi:hypothetical protein
MIKILSTAIEPLVRLIRHIVFRLESPGKPVLESIRARAVAESAEFIERELANVQLFEEREGLWDFALGRVSVRGLHLELGVWTGYSINYFASKLPEQEFFGFDSFEGLAEDWAGTRLTKGAFDLGKSLPKVMRNVTLIPGWFEKTLPLFSTEQVDAISFIHLDADTFESRSFALKALSDKIVAGSILVFDEHHGYPNWQNGEFRAWNDFVKTNNLRFRYIGFSEMAAAVQVLDSEI